jgi:hypothetical protein
MANEVYVANEIEGEVSLLPHFRGDASRLADHVVARRTRFRRTGPTRSDPAIMMMQDRSSFCCWVEPLADGARWMFLDPDGTTNVGPCYEHEDSLEAIEAVLSRWRAVHGLVEHPRNDATSCDSRP